MSQTAAEVLSAALALPDAERAELAELLVASLPAPSGLHPAWVDEFRRRAAQVDSGAVKPVPWDEVRRQAQAQLDGTTPNG